MTPEFEKMIRPLLAEFRDPELELAFQKHNMAALSRTTTLGLAICALSQLGLMGLDLTSFGRELAHRYYILIPLRMVMFAQILAVLFYIRRNPHPVRVSHAFALLTLAFAVEIPIAVSFFYSDLGRTSNYIWYLLAIFFSYTIYPIPVRYLITSMALYLVSAVVSNGIIIPLSIGSSAQIYFLLLGAYLLGYIFALRMNRGSRLEYAFLRHEQQDKEKLSEKVDHHQRVEDQLRIQTSELEKQLQQAQKMEAIGRLAGGIAHDFNNLLTGILGNATLALLNLREKDPVFESLTEIRNAADRAADLTRQLLAFSRKQLVSPRVLDLNHEIGRMEKMLARLIAEDIELKFLPAPVLSHIWVDPSQLDQIIINLVVNAGDAMPGGGQILIRTGQRVLDEEYCRRHGEATLGSKVFLEIRDNGMGMSREILLRIFEPFFTTKPLNQGTGLGLATVYGAIRQSGGHIEVESKPGEGAKFTLFFPAVSMDLQQVISSDSTAHMPRGFETLLLVEDDPLVRAMTIKILDLLGYRVLSAPDAGEALNLAVQKGESIHLLLTDVVMPHVSGTELAERMSQIQPQMKVLFTSGYSRERLGDREASFLAKPYSPKDLARKVRDVLDGRDA